MEFKQNEEINAKKIQTAQKRRKKRRQKAIRAFIGFVVILLAVAIILSLTVLFPITSVAADGSGIYTSTQIIDASGITVGENVFISGGINADTKITKKLPYIKTASVKRNFSGNIEITVTDTIAEICYFSKEQYYLCDADNKILEKLTSAPENVLQIRLSDKINGETGEYIDFSSSEDRFLADKIFNAFKSYDIDVQLIDISDDLNIKVLVDNRLVLLFGTKSEFDGKISHFMGMYTKMSKDVSGIVTLSAWSTNKQEAYFKESNIDGYFYFKNVENDIFETTESNSASISSSITSKVTSIVTSSNNNSSSVAQSSNSTSKPKSSNVKSTLSR